MILFLRVVRGITGFLFVLQTIHLIEAFTLLSSNPAGKLLAIIAIKLVAALIFCVLFFGLRSAINRIHMRKNGESSTPLPTKFAL